MTTTKRFRRSAAEFATVPSVYSLLNRWLRHAVPPPNEQAPEVKDCVLLAGEETLASFQKTHSQ